MRNTTRFPDSAGKLVSNFATLANNKDKIFPPRYLTAHRYSFVSDGTFSAVDKHGKTIQEIKALDIRYSRADETHIFALPEESLNETEKLTGRERDVAELAAKGLRNHEIAEQLFISENTVKRHLKSAFQKLNSDRRSRLVEMLR